VTVQNAEIVGYIVRPLRTGKPIARFHCKPNRTVKCSAFLSSFGIKISRVSSFGPLPTSSQSYRPKYSSAIHLYVVCSVSVKGGLRVFYPQNLGQDAQKMKAVRQRTQIISFMMHKVKLPCVRLTR